ncbi:MAG: acyl carrier protein [Magnetococcales bacterium]|nr:acyl carrier protein [Magnetococcales bacterium]NGZ06270.1 acyl carrier protein [Magnetococcales bacterium]
MEEQIKQLMADLLNLNPARIDDSTTMEEVDGWDSFNHLNLCLALEQEFGITLEVYEMEEMTSYYDICRIIQTKL